MGTEPLPDEGLYRVGGFLVRSMLSAVPIAGGALVELVNLVITDPAGKRRDAYLEDLAARILALEQLGTLKLEELASDERVGAAILLGAQIAARAVGVEKRQALRNATLAGVGIESNRALTSIVLSVIDGLTDLHLLILQNLDRPRKAYAHQRFIGEHQFWSGLVGAAAGHNDAWGLNLAGWRWPTTLNAPAPDGDEAKLVVADLIRTGLIEVRARKHSMLRLRGDDVPLTRRELSKEPIEERMVGLSDLAIAVMRYLEEGEDLARSS